MRIGGRAGYAMMAAMGVAGVLAPVRFSATEPPAPATAECTTCCASPGARCVVCSLKCLEVPDAYDNGGGKCMINES